MSTCTVSNEADTRITDLWEVRLGDWHIVYPQRMLKHNGKNA